MGPQPERKAIQTVEERANKDALDTSFSSPSNAKGVKEVGPRPGYDPELAEAIKWAASRRPH